MSSQDSKYRYKQVSIFDSKELGRGNYGRVCQALCDDLPCAAKCLHSAYFQLVEGSTEESTRKRSLFQRESQILFKVRHPCIVQYLDAYVHPELGEAVLVMELMEESLNSFLERSKTPVHMHHQFDICHDIVQALSYLHSCSIVHRNLTGSNVLMSGGSRAKVADFAMTNLLDTFSHFSSQPKPAIVGESFPYMPPEAFKYPPAYTSQLDIFSFGVICLQVMTGRYPQPSSADVSEIERRKSEIDSLEHPMMPMTLSCLKDRDILRPVASQLCRKLSQLRESSIYKESRAKKEKAVLAVDSMRKEIRDVHSKNDELMTRLEHLRYENKQLIQLISAQTESMSSNVKIAMPYTDPEDFVDIDDASLLNDGSLEYKMDLSAPHPALWYHGSIKRDVACLRLQGVAKPGAYLVRMSESDPGNYVLSFLDKQLRVFNYKITCRNGEYNAQGQSKKWFPSLQNLIGYYTRHSTVKQNQHLDTPVPPPKVVPLPNS